MSVFVCVYLYLCLCLALALTLALALPLTVALILMFSLTRSHIHTALPDQGESTSGADDCISHSTRPNVKTSGLFPHVTPCKYV